MKLDRISPEVAVDLIELVNSLKGIKYNKKVNFVSKKTGQTTEFEYTTLDKIYAHVKNNNNFALLEPIGTNEAGQPAVQIILVHRSGEVITSDYYALNLPNNGSKQDEGSAITYTKRYALGSFLGISTDNDNDANSGDGGMEITDWRREFMLTCKAQGIDFIKYAQEHGIDKKTTQSQYRDIVKDLRDCVQQQMQGEPEDDSISMSDL